MIEILEPMLLSTAYLPFDNPQYLFEFKFDGVRMIADNREDTVLYNRKGNIRTHLYPEIADSLKELKKGTVLDGEIIAIDENGKPSFYKVLERDLAKKYSPSKSQFFFVAFDILYYDGHEVMSLPLYKRKELLAAVLLLNKGSIIKAESYEACGNTLFETAKNENLEGIVAKKIDSVYIPASRSPDWQKIKCMRYVDAFACAYIIKSRPSLFLGIENGNGFTYIGNVSNGLSENEWANLLKRLESLHSGKNPFSGFAYEGAVYLKPSLMLNVKFLEQDSGGKLRQPVINKVYE